MLEKWLQRLILVGLALILLTPLVVSDSLFFPFITGKAFLFRIVTEIIFALWLILILLKAEYRPKPSAILWGMLSLVLVTTLATIFGVNPYHSFWSNYERMEGLVSYLHLLAYFLVLISVLKREQWWKCFFKASLGVNVVVCLYGLTQLAGLAAIHQGSVRLDASLGNATYLAVYVLIHIFIAAWLWYRQAGAKWWRFFYGVAIFLQFIVLYYTATRGAILGLISGGFLAPLLIAVLEKNNRRLKGSAIGVLLAIIIAVGGFLLIRTTDLVKSSPVLSRLANISLTDQTTESRLTIWRMSLEGFREKPILGWGPDNYGVIFSKYFEPKLWRQEPWFDRSHNIFLDWMTNTGLLGLLAYLSLFVSSLYYLWRRRSNFSLIDRSLFTGLLAAYFFHNLFVFDNLVSYLLFMAILAYFHFRATQHTTTHHDIPNQVQSEGVSHHAFSFQIGVLLIVVALGTAMYFVNLKPILAGRTLISALLTSDVDQKLSLFRKSLAYNTFGNGEIRDQIANYAMSAIGNSEVSEADQVKIVLSAVAELKKQVAASPRDTRTRLIYGLLLASSGNIKEAIIQLEKTRELSPDKQQVLFQLAKVYQLSGDKNKYFELAEQTYDLDKSYPQARRFLINAAAENKKYDILPELWLQQVNEEPNNPQNVFSLAAAYLYTDQKQLAIKALEDAIKKFPVPEIKQQAEALIKEIKAGRNPAMAS